MLAGPKQLAELVSIFHHQGHKQTYRKSEFIIRPGEAPSGVFFIDEGLVKAYDVTKYGEENLLIIRKAHEIFPLIWGLTGQERHIIYETLAPTTTWKLDQDIFLASIHTYKSVAFSLLDMTLEMYRLHSERILNLEYRTVRQRLISFLLTMATRFGEPHKGSILLKVPLRHQDIASSINASRETTTREMTALEKKGLISNKQSLILLKDMEALHSHLI